MARQKTVDRIAARYERKLNLHDPEYNLRETAKQMVLLEEHLFQPHKLCPDCVRKHLLIIEALAEEMVSLTDPEHPHHKILRLIGPFLSELARKWVGQFNDGAEPLLIAIEIRKVRKLVVAANPDPRRDEENYDPVDRIASVYILKQNRK